MGAPDGALEQFDTLVVFGPPAPAERAATAPAITQRAPLRIDERAPDSLQWSLNASLRPERGARCSCLGPLTPGHPSAGKDAERDGYRGDESVVGRCPRMAGRSDRIAQSSWAAAGWMTRP
jgi:hypothetical protein